jgi:hypothetical protein
LPTGSANTRGHAPSDGRHRRQRGRQVPAALGWAALAGVSALAGAGLALHHPLSATLALLLCVALALLAARWPLAGLALLPAALPAIGLMPWSGWLTF